MKHQCINISRNGNSRPFTGAWIETTTYPDMAAYLSVAPSRGRGLKLT